MPNESRKKLYDAVSSKYDIGTFDEFNRKMDDRVSREKFYSSVSRDFDLGDFSTFESKVSLKKKEQPISKGFGIGSEPSQPYRPSVLMPGVEPVYGKPTKPKTVAEAQKEEPVSTKTTTQMIAPLMATLNSITGGFYKIPRLIYNTAAIPQNVAAELMNRPELKADYDSISKGTYNPLSIIDRVGDYSMGVSKDWESKQKKYDKDLTDNILSGNFKQAGEQLSDNLTGSIPAILSMYLTGGAASAAKMNKIATKFAKAAPFASTKTAEIENNPNIPDYLKPLNSWMYGLSEVIYEEAFGTKSIIDNALSISNNDGVEAGVKFLSSVLNPATTKVLNKIQPITNVVLNGIEEGVTQISQNIIDKYTGVDPNRDIMDGVSDAIIVGSAQGLGATGVGKGIEYISDAKRAQKVKQLEKARVDIINDIDNDAVPEDTKVDLDNKLSEINEQLNNELAANREDMKNIPVELTQEANRIQDEIEAKEQTVGSEVLSEQSRNVINQDIAGLKKELDNVNKKIKDAVQIEAAGQVPVQPEARVGEEVAQGEPQAEPQEVTEVKEEVIKRPDSELFKNKVNESDVPTLKSKGSDFSVLYVPRRVVELAYENDEVNKNRTGGPQSLDTIVRRGGYSIEELNKLLPNWRDIASNENVASKVEAPQVKEEVRRTPLATSEFAAVDVIDYNEPEINKYKPSEQLNFKQGTFGDVTVVGDEGLIRLVQAGSERQLKLDGKPKKALRVPESEVADLEAQFGITAAEAYQRAKDLAKENRSPDVDRIVLIGDKVTMPSEVAKGKATPSKYSTREYVLNEDGTTELKYVDRPDAKPVKGYGEGLNLFSHKREDGKIVISDANSGARIVESDNLKSAKQKLDELIESNGGLENFSAEVKKRADNLLKSLPKDTEAKPKAEAKKEEAPQVSDLASKIRALKITVDKGKLQANIAGLPVALYNSAIEFIATSVEAGESIASAIDKAIKKYKLNDNKSFKENEFRSSILGVSEEDKSVSIRNEEVARKRADYGFEERVYPETRGFGKVELEAKEAIRSGKSVYDVIEKARSGAMLSDVEQAMLALFQAQKEAEILSINEKLETMGDASVMEFTNEQSKKDAAMVDLLAAYDASEVSGTEIARALNIRKLRVLQDFSLAGIISIKRTAKNNQPLTRSEVSAAEKVYAKIKKAQEALNAKMQKLNEEQSKLKLQKTLPVLVEETRLEQRQQKREVTKEEIKKERDSIKSEIAQILKNSRSELGANKIPVELIPALAKLAKNYIKEGIVNLDELVDKVHADVSDYISDLSKADVKRALSNYDKENRPTKEQLQGKVRKLRQAQDKIKESEDLKNKAKKAKKEGKTEDAEDYEKLSDDLISQVDDIASEEGIEVEDKRLTAYKDRIRKRIDELKTKIEKRDFSKAERDEIKLDAEAIKLKKDLDKIKFDYEVELAKEELANRNQLQKIRDAVINIAGVPRAIMATADYSAPLRQAAVATISYPKIAAEATKEMFKQALLPEYAEQWLADLYSSPGYVLMKDSGLYIADINNPKLKAQEEEYLTNLATKIPAFGELVKESERAYVGYLNKMRVDIFAMGVEIMQNNGKSFATHPKDFKALAKYVNDITGRGDLGKWLSGAAPSLNVMFFSPRLIISRLRLLTHWTNPLWYIRTPIEVKKMYAKDMGLFFAFGSAVMLAFSLAGADVEDDPRSTDVGKIRYGDTRWDIWAGFQQPFRTAIQSATGQTKSTATGKIKELKPSERFNPLTRFFRSKLAPVPALLIDAYTGTDMMGVPFDLKESLVEMSSPLVLQGAVESMDQDGVLFGIGATFLPSQVGFGVQTYSTNDFLKQGPDNEIIKLLKDKKALAIQPYDIDRKVYDMETGEDRKMTDTEFKLYYETWANHIKTTLTDNMGKYKGMSAEKFEDEFNKIKNQATTIAKETVTGVGTSMKTIKVTIDDELETYELTPEEVKLRKSLNEEYILKNQRVFDREYNLQLREGKSPYEAELEANKELTKKANEYSKKIILKMHKSGRKYDFEQ